MNGLKGVFGVAIGISKSSVETELYFTPKNQLKFINTADFARANSVPLKTF